MKKIILAAAAVLVSVAAFAQGTVVFNNKVGTDVVARVLLPDGVTGAGAGYTAQLYGGPAGGAVSALTPTTTFRTSSAAAQGYVNGVEVAVPGVAAGSQADIIMKAYDGASFEASKISGISGESGKITIALGGGTLPPANLTGLKGFTMTAAIPEPSTIAFAVIGAGALLLRRRK
jgi:hypothetical protein